MTLDPHIVLTFVLPPLLYSAALDSSLLAIRKNLRTVVSLSVLLVLATAVLIGVGMHLFVACTTLATGIALGAAGPRRSARSRPQGRAARQVDHPDPGRGGTRGVISLAAIFTLPVTTDAGAKFPDRDLLLFCTFVVVLVTLVGRA